MVSIFNIERFCDRKYFFAVQKLGWKLIGFWPGDDHITTFQLSLAVLNSLEVLIYGYFQLVFCYANLDNLVILLDTMTPFLTQITSAVKILVIFWKRHDLKKVLDHLKESFCHGISYYFLYVLQSTHNFNS